VLLGSGQFRILSCIDAVEVPLLSEADVGDSNTSSAG
jgi:hypothetical protein